VRGRRAPARDRARSRAVPGKQGAGLSPLAASSFLRNTLQPTARACSGSHSAKELRVETGFASDLPHHLHQSPGEASGVGLRGGDFVIRIERRNVFGEKGGS